MKISVVIPLYNKQAQVAQAIASVMAQTLPPLEIVVVNDGSTDGSEIVVAELNNPLIRLIHQENGGVSVARNKGIEMAQGDWIAFLDADDEWKLAFLETMQLLAKTYPQCRVVASAYELQDYRGIRKPAILNKIPFAGEHGILTNYFEVASCSHPPLWTSAIVAAKEALLSVGGFPAGVKSGEDLLTWARLAAQYKIAYSLLPLSIFIVDQAHEIKNKPIRLHDIKDPVGKGLIQLYKSAKTKGLKIYISHWYQMRASVNMRLNHRGLVVKYCIKSLSYNFLNLKVYLFLIMALLPECFQNKIKQIYQL
jgi:glycosyltransferase involved in cell wall biosynthesis